MNSFEKLQCPRCASNIIEIKYAVEGRIETHLYTCKRCGAWRESYGIKQKKPAAPKENRSILYPDNILNANRQVQSI